MTATFEKYRPQLLSLLRIVIGLQVLQYGMGKILKFPVVPMFAQVTPFSMYGVAGLLELVLGILILVGLFTRPAAFILSGLMAFAYFIGHAPKGFFPMLNGGDLAIIFCFVFLYLSVAGPGPWSVDAARGSK
jgi:putative oxidoreductase